MRIERQTLGGINLFKKLWSSLTATKVREEYNPSIHKLCDECGGGGIDAIAGPCRECNGDGFIEKTKEDKINDAINYKK